MFAIRVGSRKASELEASLSALAAKLSNAEKKVSYVQEVSSKDLKESERRMSSRVQALINAQGKAQEEASLRWFPSSVLNRPPGTVCKPVVSSNSSETRAIT